MVMLVGEGGDDPCTQTVHFGMRQFEGGDLLEAVVEQPGMVDQGLLDLNKKNS